MDLPLWKKANFAFFINRCSYSFERFLFYSQRQQTLFLDLCLRNGPDKNDSNNGNEHVGMQVETCAISILLLGKIV